jgi:site-specific DNA recombinase
MRDLHAQVDRGWLNREFNSLDTQREEAEAYILSQRHAGWTLVVNEYSDGG